MNYLFRPNNPTMEGSRNITPNMAIVNIFNFAILNFAIVFTPMMHLIESCYYRKLQRCNSFVLGVTIGCFLSCVTYTTAVVSAVNSDNLDRAFVCCVYIISDHFILIFLVACSLLYLVYRSDSTNFERQCLRLFTLVWALLAVFVQILCFSSPTCRCASDTLFRYQSNLEVDLPVIQFSHDSSKLVILSCIVYIPPIVVIVLKRLRDTHTAKIVHDIVVSRHHCTICVSTLKTFNIWWWKTLLCFLLAVLRPAWSIYSWTKYGELRDIPPVVSIVVVFYPVCFAQTINTVRAMQVHHQYNLEVQHV